VNVSWNDATAFCQWLSKKQGLRCDLPTEACWEYACRAGTTTYWHCGESDTTLLECAWSKVNADGKTHPVGQLSPNAWELHDVHGNVREWCADRYGPDYYAASPPNDPSGPATGLHRVIRGGGCGNYPTRCRSAHRPSYSPGDCNFHLGFGVAVEIDAGRPAEAPSQTEHGAKAVQSLKVGAEKPTGNGGKL
jgi:formylglycine-generating enzyme required for sulfatase activity